MAGNFEGRETVHSFPIREILVPAHRALGRVLVPPDRPDGALAVAIIYAATAKSKGWTAFHAHSIPSGMAPQQKQGLVAGWCARRVEVGHKPYQVELATMTDNQTLGAVVYAIPEVYEKYTAEQLHGNTGLKMVAYLHIAPSRFGSRPWRVGYFLSSWGRI